MTWSPDGSLIAFLNDWEEGTAAGSRHPNIVIPVTYRDIGVIESNGSNLKRLTFRQEPSELVWSR